MGRRGQGQGASGWGLAWRLCGYVRQHLHGVGGYESWVHGVGGYESWVHGVGGYES